MATQVLKDHYESKIAEIREISGTLSIYDKYGSKLGS